MQQSLDEEELKIVALEPLIVFLLDLRDSVSKFVGSHGFSHLGFFYINILCPIISLCIHFLFK